MGDENLAKIVFTNHFYNLFYALRVEFITHTNKDFLKGVLKENTDYIFHVNNGVITRSI